MNRAINQFRHSPRRGFTLIELVIAMAMVVLVAVVLAGTLGSAFTNTAKAKVAIEPITTADLTMQFMRDDLQNALQPGTFLAQNFEGTQAQDTRGHEDDDLVFFSTADSPQHVNANGEIKQIEFKVVQAANGDYVLVRRVTRNVPALTSGLANVNPDDEIICRRVWSFTLQYYNGSSWMPTWDSTQEDQTVPAAVQVTLQLQRPDAKGVMQTMQFTNAFPLPCSTAPQDPTVNSENTFP